MLDQRIRPTTNALLARPGASVDLHPVVITLCGLVAGFVAIWAASDGQWLGALGFFVLNRLLDGLDGAVARARGSVSDVGAYLDMVADSIVYVLLPIGVAVGHDRDAVWVATSLLVGSFAVNLVSWAHLSALLERRGRGRAVTGELTSVTMPRGLVEGAETIVWFVLFLVLPDWIEGLMLSMALAVAVGAAVRIASGVRVLTEAENLV